ncbi:MAG: orotidine-5'-phosphate decarboxylase [Myxococcota bacterium]
MRALTTSREIPVDQRLIFALDVPSYDAALALADQLGDSVQFYKLGLELSTSGRYFDLIRELRDRGKRIFADLKFYDIPATVAGAVRGLAQNGVDFATVHGNPSMIAAAVAERGSVRLLAVTVLTSIDDAEFADLGFRGTIEEAVIHRTRRAVELGCDGVIASGLEAPALRKAVGEDFLIVSPGIRPRDRTDDQRRVVTPEDAFARGADHIVVGRPIRDAEDPRAAAQAIQDTIARALA